MRTQLTLTDYQRQTLLDIFINLANAGDDKDKSFWSFYYMKVKRQIFHVNDDERATLSALMGHLLARANDVIGRTEDVEAKLKAQAIRHVYTQIKEQLDARTTETKGPDGIGPLNKEGQKQQGG